MANPVPSSFEPLASSNPVPADTDAMSTLGAQYTSTAAEIAQQASNLQQLSNNSSDAWKSKAGTVFTSKASDLATRITQAQQRYTTAGQALSAAAEPMYQAQQQAYAAVAQAQEAQSTMSANAPAPAAPAGSPPPTDAQKAAAATAASNYSAASDSLSSAQSSFNSAVDAYHTAASNAANAINHELGSDPLKDSWFQAHFEWLVKFFKILSYIIMGLAIIALLIACPFSAGLIAGILGVSMEALATVGTVIGWTMFAVGMGQTIFDGVAAGEGLQSWSAFAMDIVGDASFGIGKGAEAFGEGAVDAGTDAGKDAASDAADDAAQKSFFDTDPKTAHNTWVEANPDEAGPGAFVFSSSAIAAEAAAVGKTAGSAAAKGIADAAEAAKADGVVGNLTALGSQSSDIADDLAKLNAINAAVPNVAQISSNITKLTAAAVASGAFQWGSFGITIYGLATG
jgi:hypothetical protein